MQWLPLYAQSSNGIKLATLQGNFHSTGKRSLEGQAALAGKDNLEDRRSAGSNFCQSARHPPMEGKETAGSQAVEDRTSKPRVARVSCQ